MHDAAIVVFSGIACFLVLIPLPIQFRARNYAVLSNIAWLLAINLTILVNSIHFWDHRKNDIPVFCDISIKISIGISIAVAGCSLSINRRLADIAAAGRVSMTQRQKRINLSIDIFLCGIAPFIVMALSYIPQEQRFMVYEGLGCSMSLDTSLPSLLLVWIWPVVISAISSVYGVLAVRRFLARRLQFQTLLKSSRSGLNTGQFFRLMAMANVELFIGMPLNIALLIAKFQNLHAWPGLDTLHTNWGYVQEVPEDAFDLYLPHQSAALTFIGPWFGPLLSLCFFLFFGVAEDTIREYARWWSALRDKCVSLVSRAPNNSDKYTPKLGTAIAYPAGSDWDGPASAKNFDVESCPYEKAIVPTVGQDSTRAGVAVSVQVDRQAYF